jgi:carbon-monoxide dehydrogenase small subunit
MRLRAHVNGAPFEAEVPATASLLEVLRQAGLTGTKEGCRIGVCGVCTVVVRGRPTSACLMLAGCAQGAEVWTVEGITERDPAVADAFIACEAMQCGICTPGQVVTASTMKPTLAAAGETAGETAGEAEIRQYLSGNLCRCTGYASIVEAVESYLAH